MSSTDSSVEFSHPLENQGKKFFSSQFSQMRVEAVNLSPTSKEFILPQAERARERVASIKRMNISVVNADARFVHKELEKWGEGFIGQDPFTGEKRFILLTPNFGVGKGLEGAKKAQMIRKGIGKLYVGKVQEGLMNGWITPEEAKKFLEDRSAKARIQGAGKRGSVESIIQYSKPVKSSAPEGEKYSFKLDSTPVTMEARHDVASTGAKVLTIMSVPILLSSCVMASEKPTQTPVGAPTRVATATEVATATATEKPAPNDISLLPEGISASRDASGRYWINVKTDNGEEKIAAIINNNGIEITLTDGTVVEVSSADIANRIKIGQASPFQIYDEQGKNVEYAWDDQNKDWVDASKILQPDKVNVKDFIAADSDEALIELFRLEKLVLPPFPRGTYWPDVKNLDVDYNKNSVQYDTTPLGSLTDLSKAPTRLGVSHIIWGNEVITTEQVYNPADGSFSCLHFFMALSDYNDSLQYIRDPSSYLVPTYNYDNNDINRVKDKDSTAIKYLSERGYYISGNKFPKIESLVSEWLTNGKVPDELENLVVDGLNTYYSLPLANNK